MVRASLVIGYMCEQQKVIILISQLLEEIGVLIEFDLERIYRQVPLAGIVPENLK